ncbi:hypothetical protein BDF14DRAFT_525162 [Spinellus fusiger]|nr:hypothetical protein BDF14DRAFT_525162 [Spinellus fusiger]
MPRKKLAQILMVILQTRVYLLQSLLLFSTQASTLESPPFNLLLLVFPELMTILNLKSILPRLALIPTPHRMQRLHSLISRQHPKDFLHLYSCVCIFW